MIADFLNGLKEHTINGKHIAVFIKKVLIYQTCVTSLTSHVSAKKYSEIQISLSSNIVAAFFGESNTGKAQTNDKDPASKESQKSLRTVESILVPVSTL